MIQLVNWKNTDFPNILHFQGKAKQHYSGLLQMMVQNKLTNDPRITIVTCATDESQSKLITQLKQNNIPYVNCFQPTYYHIWDNTHKIKYLVDYLKTIQDNQIYMIVDGYDVAIQSLEGLYDKFIATGKEIMFNATKHNWPKISIDRLHERDFIGEFKYFNAGVCMGYGKALKDFYNQCLEEHMNTTENPWDSEQFIIRKVWANYSEDLNRTIDFDYNCTMFQTFGSTQLEKINENRYKVL